MKFEKIWLIKHPVSEHYQEDQSEIKRLAGVARAKVIDERQKEFIDPALVAEHSLTPLKAEKPKPKRKAPAKKKAETEAPEASDGGSAEEE